MNTRTNKISNKIGKYKLIEKLAKGSMGVVYEAYDPIADRQVAIKVSLSDHLKDPQQIKYFNQMFKREVKTASLLHHENILEVFDSGIAGGRHYIVMELVKDARMLKDFISQKELLTPESAVELICQCASGLEYAHQQGVVHRDIKPANLLVTENKQIKIADFSIALVNPNDLDASLSAGFVGSPRYMSPEQVQEDMISPQTDLYSLGVVMYELLTGKHPFEAESFSRLIYKVVNEEPQSPLEYKPDLPEKLAEIMLKSLDKDPGKRFQTGTEMIDNLEQVYRRQSSIKEIKFNTKISQNSRSLERLSTLRFFESFDQAELQAISGACQWLEFKKGDQVVEKNRHDNGFYILVRGTLSLENLLEGESFAEAEYLSTDAPAEPSIIATSFVTVVHISKELTDQLSTRCQLKIYQSLARTFVSRYMSINQQASLS